MDTSATGRARPRTTRRPIALLIALFVGLGALGAAGGTALGAVGAASSTPGVDGGHGHHGGGPGFRPGR